VTSLGTAEITLRLNQDQFKTGLATISPQMSSSLAAAGVAAASVASTAGKNAGVAFTAAAAEVISKLKITTIVQPDLDRVVKIFKASGEASGKSFVAGFAANLKGLVPALSIPDSAATSAGNKAGKAFATGIAKGAKADISALATALNIPDSKATESGRKAGGLFSRGVKESTATVAKDLATSIEVPQEVATAAGTKAGANIVAGLSSAVGAISAPIQAAILGSVGISGAAGSRAGQLFGAAWSGVSKFISSAIATGFGFVSGVAQAAGQKASELFAAGISIAASKIKQILSAAIAIPVGIAESAGRKTGELFSAAVKSATTALSTVLGGSFAPIVLAAQIAGQKAGELFSAGVALAAPHVERLLAAAFAKSAEVAKSAGVLAGEVFSAGIAIATPVISRAIDAALLKAAELAKGAGVKACQLFSAGVELAKPPIVKALESAFNAVAGVAQAAGKKAGDAFAAGVGAVKAAILQSLQSSFDAAVGVAQAAGKKAGDAFAAGVRGVRDAILQVLKSAFDAAIGAAKAAGISAGERFLAAVAAKSPLLAKALELGFKGSVELAKLAGAAAGAAYNFAASGALLELPGKIRAVYNSSIDQMQAIGRRAGQMYMSGLALIKTDIIGFISKAFLSAIENVATAGARAGKAFYGGLAAVKSTNLGATILGGLDGIGTAGANAGNAYATAAKQSLSVVGAYLAASFESGAATTAATAGAKAGQVFASAAASMTEVLPTNLAAAVIIADAVADAAGAKAGFAFVAGVKSVVDSGLNVVTTTAASVAGSAAGVALVAGIEKTVALIPAPIQRALAAAAETALSAGVRAGQAFLLGVSAQVQAIRQALQSAFLATVDAVFRAGINAGQAFSRGVASVAGEIGAAVNRGIASVNSTAIVLGRTGGLLYTGAMSSAIVLGLRNTSPFAGLSSQAAFYGRLAGQVFADAFAAIAKKGAINVLPSRSSGLPQLSLAAATGGAIPVAATSTASSAANGAAAGQAFGAAYTAGVLKNITNQSIVTALRGGGNSAEAGSTKGRQFSQAYVASVLAGLANLTNIGTSSAGAFGAAYQARLAQVFGSSNSLASSQQQTVSQSATTGTAGGAVFALNYAASLSQGAERILATIVATNAKVRERSANEGTAGGAVFALNYAAAIGAGRDRILAAMLSAVSGGGGAQRGAGEGTASGNAFAGNYAIAVSGVGARVFASLAANAGQASTSGNIYGQAFATGFERGSSNVYGVLNNISNRANTVGSSISQSISSGFASIGSAASGAAGAVVANRYVVAFTGALSAIAGAANSVITSGLNTVGAAAGAGAAAGGAFHAAFTSAASRLPGASIGNQIGSTLANGVRTSFNAGYNLGNWLRRGVGNIGRQIGQQIGSQIQFGISNAVIGLGASLFDTKNFGEADKEARRVETVAPGKRQQFQRDAQAISKSLGYGVGSKEISEGQYQALSSNFTKREDVNAIATAGTKIAISSSGRATPEDGIGGVARVLNILRNNGIDGSGRTKLDPAQDAIKAADIITGFQTASTKYTEKTTVSAIGKLLQPAAGLKLNTYDTLGFAAVASNVLDPERVNAGLPGIFNSVKKPTKKGAAAASEIGFDLSAQSLQDKGIIGFFTDLNTKLTDYTKIHGEAAKQAKLATIFGGVQAGSVAGAVIDNIPLVKESSNVIKNTKTDDQLKITQEGLIAKQTAFQNSLKELDIQIKQSVVGTVLTEAFGAAANAVKGLGDGLLQLTTWYSGLDAGTKGIVESIGKFALIIGAAVGSIVAFGAAWAIVGGALSAGVALVAAVATGFVTMAAALAPVVIPLIAVGAAVYGISKAFGATDTQAFTAAMIVVGAAVALAFGPAVIAAIGAGVVALVTGFGSIAVAAAASLIALAPYILAGAAIAAALFLAYKAFEAFKPIAEEWGRILREKIIEAWKAAGDTLNAWGKNIRDGWDATGKAFQAGGNYIAKVWNNLGDLFKAFGRGVATVATFIFDSYWGMVRGIANAIGNWIKSQGFVRGALKSVSDGVEIFRRLCIEGFNSVVRVVEWFRDRTITAFDYVKNNLEGLIQKISLLPGLFGAAGSALNIFNSQKNSAASQQPVPFVPQKVSALPGSTGSLSDNTLIGGTGDDQLGGGSPFAIGAALVSQFKKGLQSGLVAGNPSGATTVGASVYYPGNRDINGKRKGEGAIEGPEIGSRNNRITSRDAVVAIPAENAKGINQIPFGTILEITNNLTGLSTKARVADAGPFAPGRNLDITETVANAIKFSGTGKLNVKIFQLPAGVNPNQTFYFGEAKAFGGGSKVVNGPAISGAPSGSSTSTYGSPAAQSLAISPPIANKTIDQAISNPNAKPVQIYGARRPKNKDGRHHGEDYNAPYGTPVLAAFDGEASIVDQGKYGYLVKLAKVLADGTVLGAKYLHLSEQSVALFKNQQSISVKAGQTIGYVGREGKVYRDGTVTGSDTHLHFETRVNGREQDPKRFLADLNSGKFGTATPTSIDSRPGYSDPFRDGGGSSYGYGSSGSTSNAPKRPYENYDLGRAIRERKEREAAIEANSRAVREQKEKAAAIAANNPVASSKPVEKTPVIVPPVTTTTKPVVVPPSKPVETKPIVVVPSTPVVPSKPAAVTVTVPVVVEPTDPTAGTTDPGGSTTAPSLVYEPEAPEVTIKFQEDTTTASSVDGNIKYEVTESVTAPIVKKTIAKKSPAKKPVPKKTGAKKPPIPRPSTIPAVAKIKPVRKISDNNYQGTGFSKAQLLGADYVSANSGETAGTVSTTPIDTSATDDQVIGDGKNSAALAEKIREAEANLAAALENKRLTEASNKRGQTGNATALKNAQDALVRAQRDERTTKKPKGREAAKKRQELAQQKIDQLRANPGADNKSNLAANERVRKAQERVDKLKATAAEAQKKDDEAQRKADFDNIKQKIDDVKDQAATIQSQIDRDLAANPTPETQKKAEVDKADLLRAATVELDKLLPALDQLRKKYPDAESGKEANSILREINNAAATADNASTVIKKLPLSELATKADNLTNDAAAADLKADSDVLGDSSLTSAAIEDKAARYATLKAELTAVAEEAEKVAKALGDPESLKTLAAIENKLREVGDTALKTAQAANANKVTVLAEGANEITSQAEKRTLGVNIAALEGTITATEKEEALLFVRQLASQQLQELIPLLEAAKAATTDPNAIKLADEQLGKLRLYKAEVINTAAEFKRTKEEASLLYRTSKDLTESLDTGLRSILKDSLNGFRNLGSILDGILNKIADSAINAGIEALLGGVGGAKGTNKSGDFFGTFISGAAKIFGFAGGGTLDKIPNYIAGGAVSGLGGLSKAVSLFQGVEAAKQREGQGAVVLVANDRERILNERQAAVYERLIADGTLDDNGEVRNYIDGGRLSGSTASITRSEQTRSGNRDSIDRSPVQIEVTRIDEIDYVSKAQLQAILNHQLPLTARAGAAITDQNLNNTAYRSQYGIK
jgi:murein DD-endopeptidase MepM/ murein hydrolase activator NlpD/DNA-binding transcriptional ArsR family regulator